MIWPHGFCLYFYSSFEICLFELELNQLKNGNVFNWRLLRTTLWLCCHEWHCAWSSVSNCWAYFVTSTASYCVQWALLVNWGFQEFRCCLNIQGGLKQTQQHIWCDISTVSEKKNKKKRNRKEIPVTAPLFHTAQSTNTQKCCTLMLILNINVVILNADPLLFFTLYWYNLRGTAKHLNKQNDHKTHYKNSGLW